MAPGGVFNDRIGDVVEKYVRKGSKLYVEGALQTRKWTDQSGQEKYTTEVVIGRFRGELVAARQPQRGRRGRRHGGERRRLPARERAPGGPPGGRRPRPRAAARPGMRRRAAAIWTMRFRSER